MCLLSSLNARLWLRAYHAVEVRPREREGEELRGVVEERVQQQHSLPRAQCSAIKGIASVILYSKGVRETNFGTASLVHGRICACPCLRATSFAFSSAHVHTHILAYVRVQVCEGQPPGVRIVILCKEKARGGEG